MLERFTGDARGVVTGAREGALGLGHDWIGCEHLLLALATTGGEVGTLLRDQGITPERVGWETVRLAGAGRGASLSDVLDRDALASIGIDLDAVRARIEAVFGPDALTRVHPAVSPTGRPAWGKGPLAELTRRRRRRRARRNAPWPTGPRGNAPLVPGPAPRGHIPFTPRAKKSLELSLREAKALHDNYIGVQHLILALLSLQDGMVPVILSALGAPATSVRAAILARYRKAS